MVVMIADRAARDARMARRAHGSGEPSPHPRATTWQTPGPSVCGSSAARPSPRRSRRLTRAHTRLRRGSHRRPGHRRPGHRRPGHRRPGHRHRLPQWRLVCPARSGAAGYCPAARHSRRRSASSSRRRPPGASFTCSRNHSTMGRLAGSRRSSAASWASWASMTPLRWARAIASLSRSRWLLTCRTAPPSARSYGALTPAGICRVRQVRQARRVPRGLACSGPAHCGHGSDVERDRHRSGGGSQADGPAPADSVRVSGRLSVRVPGRLSVRGRFAAERQGPEQYRASDRRGVNTRPQSARAHVRSAVIRPSEVIRASGGTASAVGRAFPEPRKRGRQRPVGAWSGTLAARRAAPGVAARAARGGVAVASQESCVRITVSAPGGFARARRGRGGALAGKLVEHEEQIGVGNAPLVGGIAHRVAAFNHPDDCLSLLAGGIGEPGCQRLRALRERKRKVSLGRVPPRLRRSGFYRRPAGGRNPFCPWLALRTGQVGDGLCLLFFGPDQDGPDGYRERVRQYLSARPLLRDPRLTRLIRPALRSVSSASRTVL